MNIKIKLDGKVCESCIVGKSSQSFGICEKASLYGELLSAVVRPFIPSFSGCQYLIVFQNSFSKCGFTFVTGTNSKHNILDYQTQVLNQARTAGHMI